MKDVCSPGREPVAAKVISWITRKQVPALRTIVGRLWQLRPDEIGTACATSFALLKSSIEGHPERSGEAQSAAREICWPRRPYTGLEGPGWRIEKVEPLNAGKVLMRGTRSSKRSSPWVRSSEALGFF